MARYKNGINGAFSGKIGPVIGSSWKGVDYMKSISETSTRVPTEAQLHQRRIFAMVSSWLKPIKHLICIGYQLIKEGKTPMNAATSFVIKEAITGKGADAMIDFSKVVLSRGELLISLIKEILILLDAVLHIKWDNAGASIFNNDDDRATFVVYNPAKKAFVTFENVAQRGDKEVRLQLPAKYINDTVHCWQHFVNAEGNAVSTSVYIGEMMVT